MSKPFRWNPEKNAWLKRERGVGFEELVSAIEQGGLIASLRSKSTNHKDQRQYLVNFKNYVVVIPYVEETDYIFLKTAFPSRKATKNYLRNLV